MKKEYSQKRDGLEDWLELEHVSQSNRVLQDWFEGSEIL